MVYSQICQPQRRNESEGGVIGKLNYKTCIFIMTIYRKIGITIIVLGVSMFFLGASMFTYQGEVSRFMLKVGEFSFSYWLPIIILGIFIMVIGKKK